MDIAPMGAGMKLNGMEVLKNFGTQCEESSCVLNSWYCEVVAANWSSQADIWALYKTAYLSDDGRIVFLVGEGKYFIATRINFSVGIVLINLVGIYEKSAQNNNEEG